MCRIKLEKIVFIRHGQSEGNIDYRVYDEICDDKIPLTGLGKGQAQKLGENFFSMCGIKKKEKINIFCSTHLRAMQTLSCINKSCPSLNVISSKFDPRLVEQKWGNMGDCMNMEELARHGHFQYTPRTGESGLEVYVRIKQFLNEIADSKETVVIVSHGIAINTFLMILFGWSPDEFNSYAYPSNCLPIVVEQRSNGEWEFIKNEPKIYNANTAKR